MTKSLCSVYNFGVYVHEVQEARERCVCVSVRVRKRCMYVQYTNDVCERRVCMRVRVRCARRRERCVCMYVCVSDECLYSMHATRIDHAMNRIG